ncbi:hypothetical protein NE282_10870 [Leuconostoc mesenteroides]|uniref:hypothetical protein n=1 Tax=Leuconostoc mesenteroides TaxID=1245 RepID=UPI002073E5D2|nr:hypothetical protein [Leuconostoc mesenteroides]MCM6834377.1 hypothetical protein [Leuconostoc mesenteroides]
MHRDIQNIEELRSKLLNNLDEFEVYLQVALNHKIINDDDYLQFSKLFNSNLKVIENMGENNK